MKFFFCLECRQKLERGRSKVDIWALVELDFYFSNLLKNFNSKLVMWEMENPRPGPGSKFSDEDRDRDFLE